MTNEDTASAGLAALHVTRALLSTLKRTGVLGPESVDHILSQAEWPLTHHDDRCSEQAVAAIAAMRAELRRAD